MQSPGTTAVLEGPAGFEAKVARAAAITSTGPMPAQGGASPLPVPAARPAGAGSAAAGAAAGPATMSGLPSGRDLPCTDDPELFFA